MPQLKASKPELVLRSHRALEMIMRSTLDSLHDAACIQAFNPHSDCVLILSISPPNNTDRPAFENLASIHALPRQRTTNVLDFLMLRESHSDRFVI
jgi:hypothetical protein